MYTHSAGLNVKIEFFDHMPKLRWVKREEIKESVVSLNIINLEAAGDESSRKCLHFQDKNAWLFVAFTRESSRIDRRMCACSLRRLLSLKESD